MSAALASTLSDLNLEAIHSNHDAISDRIRHTPVVEIEGEFTKSNLGGGRLHLKLECFQHTGSFKARGALTVARAIPEDRLGNGITAASAGNHAIAAAWAAKELGLSAKVAMQSTANAFRVALAKSFGAEVVMCDGGVATIGEAQRLQAEAGRTFIHPFEGINTTLGTSGVGLEFIRDVPDLDAVVVAIGGGGSMSGVAAAIKLTNPSCKVYGVEPKGADSMSQSFAAGKPIHLDALDTIADSLAPPMALPFGYAVCRKYVDDIVTVGDDQICAGMVALQEQAKLAVEPAAGAAMAGMIWPLRERLQGKKVGVLVCGANIDARTYMDQLERGRCYMLEEGSTL